MVEIFPVLSLSDEELTAQLKAKRIGLTLPEIRKVTELLGRDPTLVEATIWGIQGSEHSSYKSSRKYLGQFLTKGSNVILGPSEDSGVVRFTDEWGIVVSHESHNAPSQIVPYEGAATGIGGIVRDVLCMGAKVIGTLDPLRFGEIDRHLTKIIANGVISGIAGYGNPIGVPSLGGDISFDRGYNEACLVNVVAFGLLKNREIIHSFAPVGADTIGYDFILIGKPTDQSGFGGAAFASVEIDPNDKEANRGAVQEPNPFLERHLIASTVDLINKLRERGDLDKVGFKDLGAGGVLCASVELIADEGFGAEIELDRVHTAFSGLKPEVIACSETQERFCWVVHPSLTEFMLDHYNRVWDLPGVSVGAKASQIGKVVSGDRYKITYNGEVVCDAKATDITAGLRYDRPFSAPKEIHQEPKIDAVDTQDLWKKLLSSENIASKECVYEKYDKTVQGISWFEPGEADAGVIRPLLNEGVDGDLFWRGMAVKADGNARHGLISPYWQGANAVIESMRNVAATGATPIALTDCLNYGNPELPEQMWEFVEGVRGVAEAAKAIHTNAAVGTCHGTSIEMEAVPIVSGNVSLYKTSYRGAIPPSAIVACLGIIPDVRKATNQKLKSSDSVLLLIGERKDELGASEVYRLLGHLGANVPQPDFDTVTKEIFALTTAIQRGLVRSCHDISEGGIAVTLAEMAMGNQKDRSMAIGAMVNLENVGNGLPFWKKCFSESGGWVLEVDPVNVASVDQLCAEHGVSLSRIGQTSAEPAIAISDSAESIQLSNTEIFALWGDALRNRL